MATKKQPTFIDYTISRLAGEIGEIMGRKIGVEHIVIPPSHISSDLTVPTAVDIHEVEERIKKGGMKFIKDAKADGPFFNIKLNRDALYSDVLENVMTLGERYGESDINSGKKAFIEYSSPNIAKPIGVGHLRSTIIGEALVRIYRLTGYDVFRENHLGDWGTQFGKLIYAYQTWGDKAQIKQNPIHELKRLYVRFQEASEKDEQLNEKAREIFKRLEEGDAELLKLWKEFRELSIKEFKKIYERLDIVFDNYGGESRFVQDANVIVESCLEQGVCVRVEGGAVVVEPSDVPSFLLQKQDGSTLYLTRDLAALKYRIEKHKPDIILYVVGSEQTLHFKQLFEVAGRLDYLDGTDVRHISFGMVLKGGKRMATRKGTFIELEDVLNQAIEKSKSVITEKSPELSPKEREEVANMVGIGAIIYNDLKQSRTKDISFNWEKMLNLESGSAVYLQYTSARINSLIKKAEGLFHDTWRHSEIVWEEKPEFELAKRIMFFPAVVIEAQKRNEPNPIALYLEELARTFNNFYNETSVIRTEDETLRNSRIRLTHAVGLVIRQGLNLLNIKVPERM